MILGVCSMIRFIIALVMAKMALLIYKLTGRTQNDRPGLLANKICPDFLKRINKPKIVICVSGTNGKTSIVNFMADIMREKGYKVAYNDWGANIFAGHARLLLDAVNIFNKSTKEVAIIEVDEKTSHITIPMLKPNYFIVTNLFRDSIRRNGHIEFIYKRLDEAFLKSPETVAVLNACDPISSNLAAHNKRIFVKMNDAGFKPLPNVSKEYLMCPICGAEPHYNYRLYRSIGEFECKNCGYHSPNGKYTADVSNLTNKEMVVIEEDKEYKYKLINDSVFYAYNLLFVIAVLRELGMECEELSGYVKNLKITSFRNFTETINGVEVNCFASKGQNGSSSSSVFEYITTNKDSKQVIIFMDELYGKYHPLETLTWLYEADFEFLKSPNIKKIIIGGKLYRQYKVRCLLAGIPEDKLVCVENEEDTVKYLDLNKKDKIFILYDVDLRAIAIKLLDYLRGVL